MHISVLASGSNGNSTLIEDKEASVLIDAGKSCKELEKRANNLGKSLENVDAIILTHSHVDHYQGIGPVSRKFDIPVYTTKETYELCCNKIGNVNLKHFSLNSGFKIKNLDINPINTSHDVPSCGFVIGKFGLFTDTGIVTRQMQDSIKKLHGILIESNHDLDMVINGPYPAFLKNRIISDEGHLSNIHASSFIQEKANGLSWALLSHLSANNNTPDKTRHTFESIVKKKIDYTVLSRDKESGVWEL